MFIDISKAYLHADVLNDSIYVELPGEMNMPNMCGRLLRALYGTRQAARAWEEEHTKTLKGVGFQKGKCNPCMDYHSRRDENPGPRRRFHGRRQRLGAQVRGRSLPEQVKNQSKGILGSDLHDMKAMTILNRIVEWTDARIQYEADPRHVDLIIEELGLENANGSDVTGSKVDINETDTELDHEDACRFRSTAARLNFLAADRIDIQFASKETCRRMSSTCMSDWAKVRKLGRYLRKHRRQVLRFAWQDVQSNLQVYVDTDYAGCPRTRRSTNGGLVMHGSHLLKTWASTQTVVELCTAE